MGKIKTTWVCNECGYQQKRWAGQCTQCFSWNSIYEEIDAAKEIARYSAQQLTQSEPVLLKEISGNELHRIGVGIQELDRVFGGGVVPGALSLIGGEPGIGKSTLLLQMAHSLLKSGHSVLYVTAEESVQQTALRARRLGIKADNLYLMNESSCAAISAQVQKIKPQFVIIDSIQMIYKSEISSAPGSVSQVRECTTEFMHLSKRESISIFLVGHVTKSGEIAGPRVLEHLVDTVLYFEGDKHHQYRLLRVIKNRFGPTDEIAVFQMMQTGLEEVKNPSQLFIQQRQKQQDGIVVTATLEGSRAMCVEIQSLVTESVYPSPARRSTGMDLNRLALLIAVLEKRMKYPLYRCDIFTTVIGGFKLSEPSSDLAFIVSVASSFRSKPLASDLLFLGEVGLGGEIRSVPRVEPRLKEAVNLGFSKVYLPKGSRKGIPKGLLNDMEVIEVSSVQETLHQLWGSQSES